jgi:SAM-dependent methyltransferase
MLSPPPSDPTVAYYDAHAEDFTRDTVGVGMTPLSEPFLALVRPGGRILDAGCGSGRDALAFKQLGYMVTAFDASAELAKRASLLIGQPVEVLRFQEMTYEEGFDGVWGCASLLHVPRSEMDGVLERVIRALNPGGVLFASFKMGDGEEVRDGRFFNSYQERDLNDLFGRHPELEVVHIWRTADQRPDRRTEAWVNVLALRRD